MVIRKNSYLWPDNQSKKQTMLTFNIALSLAMFCATGVLAVPFNDFYEYLKAKPQRWTWAGIVVYSIVCVVLFVATVALWGYFKPYTGIILVGMSALTLSLMPTLTSPFVKLYGFLKDYANGVKVKPWPVISNLLAGVIALVAFWFVFFRV
ncbi:MAG: hypothetical protein LIR46_05350 [Bacteroidota bacterium]|nr:hypothetical protein [Bacteroidota bacterium]